jgi:hypothetical protein
MAGLRLNVTSYEEYKTYFDFWFNEFEPFDPTIHYDPVLHYGDVKKAALAHWLPP